MDAQGSAGGRAADCSRKDLQIKSEATLKQARFDVPITERINKLAPCSLVSIWQLQQ